LAYMFRKSKNTVEDLDVNIHPRIDYVGFAEDARQHPIRPKNKEPPRTRSAAAARKDWGVRAQKLNLEGGEGEQKMMLKEVRGNKNRISRGEGEQKSNLKGVRANKK
jgi:hypothetical protein